MNKLLVFPFVCCVFLSSSLKADVYGYDRESKVNIITQEGDNGEIYVKFEYCQVDRECEPLGSREFYSLQELRKRRFFEKLEWFLLFGGVGAAAVLASGAATSLLIAAGPAKFAAAPLMGLGVFVGTLTFIGDPFEQVRQVDVISDDVLEDRDSFMKGRGKYTLPRYVERLSLLLSKIDAQDEVTMSGMAAEASYP